MSTVTSYDPDSQFTLSALFQLEGVGIPVMTVLNNNIQFVQKVLSTFVPNVFAYTYATSLFNTWLSYHWFSSLRPTWRNLLLIIRLLNLDDLAKRMEIYLSAGATDLEEQHSDSKAGSESKGELIQSFMYTYNFILLITQKILRSSCI